LTSVRLEILTGGVCILEYTARTAREEIEFVLVDKFVANGAVAVAPPETCGEIIRSTNENH
jgi:hypothetical protein